MDKLSKLRASVGDPTLRSHRSVFERIAKTLDDTDVVRDVEKSDYTSKAFTYASRNSIPRGGKPCPTAYRPYRLAIFTTSSVKTTPRVGARPSTRCGTKMVCSTIPTK